MVVNQANYFQFAIDDIEEAHSHVSFGDLASDRAGYKLRDTFDSEVLHHMCGFTGAGARRTALETNSTKADSNADNDELLPANKLDITDFGGSDIGGASEITSIPIAAGGGAGGITSPLAILNRIARQMDQASVDTDSRWCVVDPVFAEVLMDEDSKLINSDFGGGDELRNGRMPGQLRGFTIYKSNNLPSLGTGAGTAASAGSEANMGFLVAGHSSAVATAEQIAKTETFRSPTTFADIVQNAVIWTQNSTSRGSIYSRLQLSVSYTILWGQVNSCPQLYALRNFMPSTYIDLSNKTLRRLNEVEIPVSDFLTVRGVQALVKDAVRAAIAKINQAEFEWPFNAAEFTQTLVAGQSEYSGPQHLKKLIGTHFRL